MQTSVVINYDLNRVIVIESLAETYPSTRNRYAAAVLQAAHRSHRFPYDGILLTFDQGCPDPVGETLDQIQIRFKRSGRRHEAFTT